MTETQSPDKPVTTLDDIAHVFGHDAHLHFTYRSFEVVDSGNAMVSVRLGSWNPLAKLFTPHGQLLLSETAARLLVKQLQAHLDGLSQVPWYQRFINAFYGDRKVRIKRERYE